MLGRCRSGKTAFCSAFIGGGDSVVNEFAHVMIRASLVFEQQDNLIEESTSRRGVGNESRKIAVDAPS